jgi:hypothetical protein
MHLVFSLIKQLRAYQNQVVYYAYS